MAFRWLSTIAFAGSLALTVAFLATGVLLFLLGAVLAWVVDRVAA